MKLSFQALELIGSREGLKIRNRLAYEMNCSQASIERWLNENDEDGKLTTATALKIISEETGINMDDLLIKTDTVEK